MKKNMQSKITQSSINWILRKMFTGHFFYYLFPRCPLHEKFLDAKQEARAHHMTR